MTPLIKTIRDFPLVPGVNWSTIETLIILLAMLGAALFVVAYPFMAQPRYWTREGWHIWLFTLVLFLLGGSSVTRRIWPESPDHPAYTVAILATYGLLAGLIWHRVVLLFTARRYDQRLQERSRR